MNDLTISIVSHGQAKLVSDLLSDLAHLQCKAPILLTLNLSEELPQTEALGGMCVVNNSTPKGFGANHNAAFVRCETPFFCIANPDIRLRDDLFPALLRAFDDPKVGAVAPLVVNAAGFVEDSARYFPTLCGLGTKALGLSNGRYPIVGVAPQPVDWIAGMFMVFRSSAFETVGGFDEGFFLYYEDVDICVRLWKTGWRVVLVPEMRVQHDAQRASRKELRYLRWHLTSMLRYLWKHWGRLPMRSL